MSRQELLSPDLVREVHKQAELGAFVIQSQRIPSCCRGEAALGTDTDALKVDVLRCLADATLQIVESFQPRSLGADETQYNALGLWQKAQWLEVAGPRGVIL